MFRTLTIATIVAVAVGTSAAGAESASELLEKGIYTEETVGDLDAAITIYEKVVADAKAGQSLAAEAQFRMGQCLLKKDKKAEATAAFEKLIRDFPGEKELVAKAKQYVPGQADLKLGDIPWKNGEFMQLSMKLGGETRIGAMIWAIESAKLDGKDVCRSTLHRYVGEMHRGVSHVEADPVTSQPIQSVFQNTLMGNAKAEYMPGKVTVTTQDAKEKESVKTVALDKVYYDQEQACQILRRLPLAEGYGGLLPIFIPVGGVKFPTSFEVVAKETLEVPAGKFECFKIPLPQINQTLWYTTDTNRYLVQIEAPGAMIQLEQLGCNRPGEMRTCKNEPMGCSFSIPAGWYYYEATSGDGPKSYVLIDPEEVAINFVGVWKIAEKDTRESDGKKAVRAFAEEGVAAGIKGLKDYKVRPDSWKEFTVGGLPAISVVGDYVLVQQKKTDYSVHVLGETTKAQLRVSSCDPDKLDSLHVEFDKIVDTLKIK